MTFIVITFDSLMPFFIKKVIEWFEDDNRETKHGIVFSVGIIIYFFLRTLILKNVNQITNDAVVIGRAIIFGLIFDKFRTI